MLIESSRRLTGPNRHFNGVAVVLESEPETALPPALFAHWQARVRALLSALHWPEARFDIRSHAKGFALAFTAPLDQLLTASDINDWAFLSALGFLQNQDQACVSGARDCTPSPEICAYFKARSAAEAKPALSALCAQADALHLPYLLDDEALTLGAGRYSTTFALNALPELSAVNWPALHAIPVALVTGSNGKTTTTRLLAAMLKATGKHCGHNCTDGVYVDGSLIEAGDYSGPAGARAVLRHCGVEAAVIETARGGLLRRGLALDHADAAIVTNISEDHFGEYGVFSLADLAEVKLIVAHAVSADGVLVLNADDPTLRTASERLQTKARLAWFGLDYDAEFLQHCRAQGLRCAGVCGQQLQAFDGQHEHDLGDIRAMPLSVNGSALYNISNIAGAVLLAMSLKIDLDVITGVLKSFGSSRFDNPGRLERWDIGGVTILMDYAHNPEGLSGLLQIGQSLKAKTNGRLGLLLGQAGNREDDDIRALAATAAQGQPDFIVIKELESYQRGRAAGEVPALLHSELQAQRYPEAAMAIVLSELEAVHRIVALARCTDVLVLGVHDRETRAHVGAWFDQLQAQNWQPAAL